MLEYNDQLKNKATRFHEQVLQYKTFEASNSISIANDESPLNLDIDCGIYFGSRLRLEVIRYGNNNNYKAKQWLLKSNVDTCAKKGLESLKDNKGRDQRPSLILSLLAQQ